MNSIEKALTLFCIVVTLTIVVLLIKVLQLTKAIEDLNTNQETLQEEIEKVDSFNIKMWEDQIEINRYILGIPNETY